ncbi:MAG: hypothetical protein EOP83_17130, partial [Verrucomicrobiaceae bacterium]
MKPSPANRFRIKALALSACLIAIATTLSYHFLKSPADGDKKDAQLSKTAKPMPGKQTGAVRSIEEWRELITNTETSGLRSLIEEAMRISDPSMRNELITSITERWLREDISGFNKYWFALEVDGADDKLSMVALALQAALANLTPELAASDEIYVVVQRLISHLAGTDPEKALAWAKKWLLDDAQESALVSIARGMSRTDIDSALAIIEDIKSPLRSRRGRFPARRLAATSSPRREPF